MNYALMGALLFLASSYLTSSLKGKNWKVKTKAILSYLGFFLLFGIFILTYHSVSSSLLENPIIQKITQ
jgi:hypothetical protein